MTSGSRHIATLDAVRGLAAISVLLIHIGWVTGDRSIARFGYLAVDLFFVMSGFVIARAYEEKLLTGMRWHQFMLLRIARLYPSLFLGILLGLVAYFVVPAGTYRLGWHSAGHLLLIPDVTAAEGIFPLNGVIWSLFFELVINALHGLMVRRLTILRLSVFVLAMGLWWGFAASVSGNWGGGWNQATFIAGFARVGWGYGAGVLLHRLTRSHASRWRIPAIVPIALAALVLLLPNFGMLRTRIPLSVFVFFPVVVALAIASDVPAPGRGVARWLGAISYPLYAIHHPLLLMIASRFDITSGAARAAVAVVILIIATIVEYAYDAPVRKRLRASMQNAVVNSSEPQ